MSDARARGGRPPSSLGAERLRLAYDEAVVIEDLSLVVPDGKITAIVGPNACGKSTLLRALARLLKPKAGAVLLDGEQIHRLRSREVARRLGLLPQSPVAPEGILVGDLVARGRSPHQSLLHQWSEADERAVLAALQATETADLANRGVDELSGGQRQRVWIAMALAQETPLLLLDEPTTFLDIAHQMEVLELVAKLNAIEGRTIVLVLHDLNHASRYADHLVAMKEGAIAAAGAPADVVTEDVIRDVFGIACHVISDPVGGTPLVIPIGSNGRTSSRRRREELPTTTAQEESLR